MLKVIAESLGLSLSMWSGTEAGLFNRGCAEVFATCQSNCIPQVECGNLIAPIRLKRHV